jgi:hypothetical protein
MITARIARPPQAGQCQSAAGRPHHRQDGMALADPAAKGPEHVVHRAGVLSLTQASEGT